MFRSATFKLTVWYTVIIVLISLMFSAVVYRLAASELANGLAHQSARFSNEYPAFSSNPLFREQSELADGTHQIITNLIVFNVFVFITAGFASYALARRTLQPIEMAHEQQKRFTADVSHELRTPLTALRMETEVALLDKNNSKTSLRDTLRSNLEEAAKLEQLISSLMRLTKLEATELQQQFINISLPAIVDEAVAVTTKVAQAQTITIKTDVAAGFIHGDRASLVQLLVVLLDNAIKYSKPMSVVTIKGMVQNEHATISVSDTGVGIEPRALSHVFERFYRADKARTDSSTSGYGLGLSIAKYIADMHAGCITLRSRTGHGTTATVQLPTAH
jgi:two-component system sensor histidine kinase CiaH